MGVATAMRMLGSLPPIQRRLSLEAIESESEFDRNLPDPRWRCFQHVSECRAVDVSVDRAVGIKLRVVEGVEGF